MVQSGQGNVRDGKGGCLIYFIRSKQFRKILNLSTNIYYLFGTQMTVFVVFLDFQWYILYPLSENSDIDFWYTFLKFCYSMMTNGRTFRCFNAPFCIWMRVLRIARPQKYPWPGSYTFCGRKLVQKEFEKLFFCGKLSKINYG